MYVRLDRSADLGKPALWAIEQLRAALRNAQHRIIENDEPIEVEFRIGTAATDLFEMLRPPLSVPAKPESFLIRSQWIDDRVVVAIAGLDDRGVKFGCLEAAEQIAAGARPDLLEEMVKSPYLAVRGLSTYLQNRDVDAERFSSTAFRRNWFDMLSWSRFNRFTLVFGHRTDYLVPVFSHLFDMEREFPDIRVKGGGSRERRRWLEALQRVGELCEERGVEFSLGISRMRPDANGEEAVVQGTQNLRLLADYMRAGLARLLKAIPQIRTLQLQAGAESGVSNPQFFFESFVPAIRECGRAMTVELLGSEIDDRILKAFRDSGARVVIAPKYSAEHQTMPWQPAAMAGGESYGDLLRSDRPDPLLWRLCSFGSHRLFFWGDPDYGRRFVRSCRLGDGIGFDVTPPGSQKGYSEWGQVDGDWSIHADQEFFTWEFQRYWFFWLVLGRLGFDPDQTDEVFVKELRRRFGELAAVTMFRAYRAASRIVSFLIAQRMDDPRQYVWPELDCGGPIDHHIHAPAGEPTLFENAAAWARRMTEGEASARLSPADASERLEALANEVDACLRESERLVAEKINEEARLTRTDFRALVLLARYHATKLRMAAALALFYETGDATRLFTAERLSRLALHTWRDLGEATTGYFDRLHFGPTGGRWDDNLPRVEYDLGRIAQVKTFLEEYGLFSRGIDFGPSPKTPFLANSVLDSEPRFTRVNDTVEYWPEIGYGWLDRAGLTSEPPARPDVELAHGVFRVKPGRTWGPDALDNLPLEVLTKGSVSGSTPARFRIDADPGRYEITLLAPRSVLESVRLEAERGSMRILQTENRSYPEGVTWRALLEGYDFVLHFGPSGGRWSVHAMMLRPVEPIVRHLPPMALAADNDLELQASADAPSGIASLTLLYLSGGAFWRKAKMAGGLFEYRATIPATHLDGDSMEYFFEARAEDGAETSGEDDPFTVPLVRGFRQPVISDATGPETWDGFGPLAFSAIVRHGEFAKDLVLHYREANQRLNWRTASRAVSADGEHRFEIDPHPLDAAYPLLYYFELTNVFGGGVFRPDPWTDARYRIVEAVVHDRMGSS